MLVLVDLEHTREPSDLEDLANPRDRAPKCEVTPDIPKTLQGRDEDADRCRVDELQRAEIDDYRSTLVDQGCEFTPKRGSGVDISVAGKVEDRLTFLIGVPDLECAVLSHRRPSAAKPGARVHRPSDAHTASRGRTSP